MRKIFMASMLMKGLNTLLRGVEGQYKPATTDLAKIHASMIYLQTVKTTRLLFISLLGIKFCMFLFISAFILLHVGLIFYAPWSDDTKMTITIVCAVIYLAASVGAFVYGFSQKKWMEIFNVDEVLDKILGNARENKEKEYS